MGQFWTPITTESGSILHADSHIYQSTLSNGIRVVSQPSKLSGASICLHVSCGAQYDSNQPDGISHLVEHMLFKGTSSRTAAGLSAGFNELGAWCNASTNIHGASYYLSALSEDIPDAFDLLADMYLNSTFPEEVFETERLVLLNEVRACEDDNDSFFSQQFFEGYLNGHLLGRSAVGTADSLRGISMQQALDYKQAHYVPSRTVVAAAGDIRHDDIVEMVSRQLGMLEDRPAPVKDSSPIIPAVGVVRNHLRDVQQTMFCLAYPAVGECDPKIWTVLLLRQILGGGAGSRLFQEIREKQGLAYGVSASLSEFVEGSIFMLGGSCDASDAQKTVELCHAEALRLAREKVRDEELRHAKRQLRTDLLLDYNNHLNQAFALAAEMGNLGFIRPRAELLKNFESVTANALMQAAAEIFTNSTPRLETLGPDITISF